MYGRPVTFNAFENFCKNDSYFRSISVLIVMFLLTRPRKVDFLFCISHPHLQKTGAFVQLMDILLHLLNLSWPSLFEIAIVSNNFNNEETCSGSLHSFPTNVSDCALFFSSLYLCQQFVLEDNSFYKKRPQLLRQPLRIRNSKTWKFENRIAMLRIDIQINFSRQTR